MENSEGWGRTYANRINMERTTQCGTPVIANIVLPWCGLDPFGQFADLEVSKLHHEQQCLHLE